MDQNKQNYFKTRRNNQFKRKGDSNRRGRGSNSRNEQLSRSSNSADTVYRILCPSRKIGGVIGKGGNIIKALRVETQATITVADPVPGSDERVIIIYSSPTKILGKHNPDEDLTAGNEYELMEPHCAAQDALLRVHDRIVEEELSGGVASDDDNESTVVTVRLLVPNNMVGCLLGRGGDVIQRLRSDTGASIRVLPSDHLRSCAMSTDELVQISGKNDVVKRALYEVSTHLHQNPRKDKPPMSFSVPYGGQSFSPALSPSNSSWPQRNSAPYSLPPVPWMGDKGKQPSRFGPGGFSGVPPRGREAPAEFSMKILCAAGKIGGVIGKGGFVVRQLQQETGASIHVEDASTESDDRVIRVSAYEVLCDPRSQTIDAILQLQNKTSEFSEKGTITSRLLVPSSKVGCILGQGGNIINDMRRRTQADIRVYSKDDKPKCASEDEELVQISGNFRVAEDALGEIASRLRVRTLRDANAGAEPAPTGPVQGFGPGRSLPGSGPPPSAAISAGKFGGYEPFRGGGGREYEPQSYPVPPTATGYPYMNSALEAKVPNNASSSLMGTGRSTMSNIDEVSAASLKLQDYQYGGSNLVQYHGSSEHPTVAQNLQAFMGSAGQQTNAQQNFYHSLHAQQSPYESTGAQQSPYKNLHVQQSPYQKIKAEHSPYPGNTQHMTHAHINGPNSAYHNYGAQQGAYH
ncbi:hypothetical protein SLEP1_g27395 [Rubroshorea leprosula]|uniref:K Homology domain-containing protein n=1 Tax=Rubroshorea leprosula TaxID=152421 RepID=A0AAV5JWC7_9ROSI|nr:hypothetical protein SLEP1_g27395 [Rubroshorea leprosula]